MCTQFTSPNMYNKVQILRKVPMKDYIFTIAKYLNSFYDALRLFTYSRVL